MGFLGFRVWGLGFGVWGSALALKVFCGYFRPALFRSFENKP